MEKKIGAGHAAGMFRQGLKEIAQVLPAFPNGQHIVEEPGVAGNLVPQEVLFGKLQGKQPVYGKDQAQDQGMER